MRTDRLVSRLAALPLVIALVVALAMSTAGCGGTGKADSGSGKPAARGGAGSASAQSSAQRRSRRARAARKRAARRHRHRHAGHGKAAGHTSNAHGAAGRKHKRLVITAALLAHSPKARQVRTVEGAVALLRLLGFPHSSFTVDKAGRVVTIFISKRDACAGRPSDEGQIKRRMRKAFPFLHVVKVQVKGTGQEFGSWVASHCAPHRLPKASGGLVYSLAGSGSRDAGPFKIAGKHWTIAYENDTSYFQAFVLKNSKYQPEVLVSQKRGTGRKTFSGGPGTFKLRISSPGAWRIAIYDQG